MKRNDGGRGIKEIRDTHREKRLRVACYLTCSDYKWINVEWRREVSKEENSIADNAKKTLGYVGVNI